MCAILNAETIAKHLTPDRPQVMNGQKIRMYLGESGLPDDVSEWEFDEVVQDIGRRVQNAEFSPCPAPPPEKSWWSTLKKFLSKGW